MRSTPFKPCLDNLFAPSDLLFAVIGDWGRRGSPEQRAVADSLAAAAERLPLRFIVSTGDNFYEDGVADGDDSHWTESFSDVYHHESLQIPWYAAAGNHDYRGDLDAQLSRNAPDNRWLMPGRYYSVLTSDSYGRRTLLIFLDTTPFLSRYRRGGIEAIDGVDDQDVSTQLEWLRWALSLPHADRKIVLGHHPIISTSPFHGGSSELDAAIGGMLESVGVDAYLSGHDHDLQHLERNGVHHVVSGAGADVRETGIGTHSRFSTASLGFGLIGVGPEGLRIAFVDELGEILYTSALGNHPSAETRQYELAV